LNVAAGETAEFVFAWTSPEGLVVEKKYYFSGDEYTVGTEVKVFNGTGMRGAVRATTTLSSTFEEKDPYFHKGPIKELGEKVKRRDEDDDAEKSTVKPVWIGVEDKYFLKAFIPGEGVFGEWEMKMPSKSEASVSVARLVELAPGERDVVGFSVYMGPKEFDRLKKLGIEEAIEFGFMSWLAKPFLSVLNFFESYLLNYGIAIILLTVIIKILFYPLTKKSLQSMKQMQRVQPQMTAIREKYKDDKQKMNVEMMDLYKRHNVNPLGGCLPMLLQIPVFIALYEVLYAAIELRHSPFFLWIVDLSAKDPYYVTPILMGASMFLQQKMTPTAMDPMQAKIMLMLPIMFTFIFLSFPSGLVLYWLVNNLISIAQQWHIYKSMK
jgi:YidC/Oxa1 family membrane protein insertase